MIRFLLFFFCYFITITLCKAQFWSEDFSSNVLNEGWSTTDLNPGSTVLWEWCPDGPENCPPFTFLGGTFGTFQSTSTDNGYMFMNSRAAGSGFPGNHKSQLTSFAITECIDKAAVFVEMQTYIISSENNPADNALLNVWADGTWHTFHPFPSLVENNANVVSDNPVQLNFDISEVAAFQDTIYLQWEWNGKNEFAWCIDDITLYDYDPGLGAGVVWNERFNGNSDGWTTNYILESADWEWNAFGDVGAGILADNDQAIESRTDYDGAIVLNADFHTSQGEIPPGGVFPFLISELISPTIDLSEVEQPVALQFTQLVRLKDRSPDAPENELGEQFITSFAVSLDDGETWGPAIDANYCIGQGTIVNSTPIFPLIGLEGQSNIKLKFTWAGDLYYWVLDDIELVERKAYDMQVNQNFFARMPNAMTPLSQIASEVFWADISNVGTETATNVNLELKIQHLDSGEIVYEDENNFGDLPMDFLAENEIFELMLNPGALVQTGSYEGMYTVHQDSTDGQNENDLLQWRFEISDSTFAKELGFNRSVAPSGNQLSYTYGNCFYVPNGTDYIASSISFSIGKSTDTNLAEAGRSITAYIYRLFGDFNDDGFIEPDEYDQNPVGAANYSFEGAEGTNLITLPIVGLGDDGLARLANDAYYMAVIEYDAENTGVPLFLNACDTMDYQATWFVSEEIEAPRFVTVLDIGNSGTFSTAGFGFKIVPQIRMNILMDVSNEETFITDNADFEILPNPANTSFSIFLSPELIGKSFQIKVLETSGKSLISKTYRNFQQKAFTFSSQNWPSGVYFVQLHSNRAHISKRVIITN